MSDTYARAGVDTGEAAARRARAGRACWRSSTRPPLPLGAGARPLRERAGDRAGLGLALCTDGVGSKLIVAEQAAALRHRGDRLRGDERQRPGLRRAPSRSRCVDYLAVERADPRHAGAVAEGLRRAPSRRAWRSRRGAGQLPELSGHPAPGFDLVAAGVGTVALDAVVTGDACAAGRRDRGAAVLAAGTPTGSRSPGGRCWRTTGSRWTTAPTSWEERRWRTSCWSRP